MKKRNIIYIVIAIVCIIAIFAGVYYEIFGKKDNTNPNVISNQIANEINTGNSGEDPEQLKEEFNSLFNNYFDNQGYDVTKISKITGFEDNSIIYAAYNIKEEKDQKYNVNINLPVFNVQGDIPAEFNSITQQVFANKANDILTKTDKYTIYNVEYTAYLNENIISLIIKSTLKEGNSAQRVIVQTYNYDTQNKKKLSLNDVLSIYGIDVKTVNKKIEEQVQKANIEAEAIAEATGQTVYKRDLDNAMYVTDNVNNFFVGLDGKIYIVYSYGNSNFTSEIDIIKL